MSILKICNLQKTYGKEPNIVYALNDVTFSVESGVFGLIGHNGAGKTILMKMLATISKPTSGSVSVCGFDTQKQGNEVRKLIGYLPQELTMYPSLNVLDFVSHMAELRGIKSRKKVIDALEQVDMAQFAKRRISQLSGGMKRRVGIAAALVGEPRVLIIDEPTAGLDPEERVIRLMYLLYSLLFLVNAFSTDTAEARPFYIFTQGDMAKLIWQHPKYAEIYAGSACFNLLFMLGVGVSAIILVVVKRRFWRAE